MWSKKLGFGKWAGGHSGQPHGGYKIAAAAALVRFNKSEKHRLEVIARNKEGRHPLKRKPGWSDEQFQWEQKLFDLELYEDVPQLRATVPVEVADWVDTRSQVGGRWWDVATATQRLICRCGTEFYLLRLEAERKLAEDDELFCSRGCAAAWAETWPTFVHTSAELKEVADWEQATGLFNR